MVDVLEHLREPFAALHELHRVLTPGGIAQIVVPHFSCANAYTDITHRSFFGYYSLDTLTGEHTHNYYTRTRFRMVRRTIEFHKTPLGKLVMRAANRHPQRYEQSWAWLYPAWFVVFDIEAVKP